MEKKDNNRQARLHGKRHEQAASKKAAKSKKKPPKNPESIFKTIPKYNTEIFENGGNLRREARTAVSFKKDMGEYAKIISSIARGVAEFQTKYPDAVLIVRQRTQGAGK